MRNAFNNTEVRRRVLRRRTRPIKQALILNRLRWLGHVLSYALYLGANNGYNVGQSDQPVMCRKYTITFLSGMSRVDRAKLPSLGPRDLPTG